MSPWSNSILAVALVSALPLLVTLVMATNETVVRRALPLLALFGAGALFGAAVLHLIPEALRGSQSVGAVILGVAAGYLLFAIIEKILARHDHAHAHGLALGAPNAHESDSSTAECVHLRPDTPIHSHSPISEHIEHRRKRRLVPMALAGDAVHNLVDGMLIAAGFLTQPSFGLLTAVAIGLHELPREVGTFGLFVHGGIRPLKAVGFNLLTALVSLVGAFITLSIGPRTSLLAQYILPFAAGTYLYIAQVITLPSLREFPQTRVRAGRLGWVVVGFSMMAISAALGS